MNALKAFEAAARHESFTRAAEELCVTQGAVSHQVKALEIELAIKLFNRERQRLIITEAGRDYLAVIRDALDRIAAGTERLLQRQSAGVLTVSTSPDFAAKWLVHRLGHFAEAHSGIDLRVSATMHHVDFAREEVDLAVRHGDGNWSSLDAVRLCSERLFAVCSPKLLAGRRRISGVADILKFPLIHLDSRLDWANWPRGVGIDDADVTHGPVLNRASMVIDAAINGQGIALARTTLAAWDLITVGWRWLSRSRCHCRSPIGSFARRRLRRCRRLRFFATGCSRRRRTTYTSSNLSLEHRRLSVGEAKTS